MDCFVEPLNSYRVEVSGWDSAENFFVEKTSLDWARENRKEVSLQSSLRRGSVVFVRLLQPLASANSFPVAYEVADLTPKDREGRTRIRLEKIRPRASLRQAIAPQPDSEACVA